MSQDITSLETVHHKSNEGKEGIDLWFERRAGAIHTARRTAPHQGKPHHITQRKVGVCRKDLEYTHIPSHSYRSRATPHTHSIEPH